MAKAYYFNYISVSDTYQSPTDEAVYICDKMVQIVIAAFKEYGLHKMWNDILMAWYTVNAAVRDKYAFARTYK